MNWLPALNMATAFLQNYNQYLDDKSAGKEDAGSNLAGNIFGSAARIGMAEDMRAHGNMMGYMMNSLVPYTNTNANQYAIGMALMGGMSPYGMGGGFYYGNPFMGAPMYPPPPPMGGSGTTIKIWC